MSVGLEGAVGSTVCGVAKGPAPLRCSTALAVALVAMTVPAYAIELTFGGFTFEQDNTPDDLELLGGGALLGGALFSAGFVTNITQSVGFQSTGGNAGSGFTGVAGFLPELSLGRQANAQHGLTQTDGTSCVFACAINMPAGNNGTVTRHGIAATWLDGRQLVNETSDDFVVYESASSPTGFEGFMVRVELSDGSFSEWRYEFADSFEAYTETPPQATEGASATAFDLSDFGVAALATIQSIQIANLTSADRVDGAGEGNVNFLGVGAAPTPQSGGSAFSSSSLDPDPLYIGVLNSVSPSAPTG